jgi:hypothetical protein
VRLAERSVSRAEQSRVEGWVAGEQSGRSSIADGDREEQKNHCGYLD